MRHFDDPVFAGLLEAAPDAMVCVDSGGRILLVNAQAERLFGYRREELAGHLVEILVSDAARPRHRALRTGYMAHPRHRPIEEQKHLSGRRRDGSIFPAEIALAAVDTDEGTLVTAAVRDVTRQRQARAELEQANRDLASFAYSMA